MPFICLTYYILFPGSDTLQCGQIICEQVLSDIDGTVENTVINEAVSTWLKIRDTPAVNCALFKEHNLAQVSLGFLKLEVLILSWLQVPFPALQNEYINWYNGRKIDMVNKLLLACFLSKRARCNNLLDNPTAVNVFCTRTRAFTRCVQTWTELATRWNQNRTIMYLEHTLCLILTSNSLYQVRNYSCNSAHDIFVDGFHTAIYHSSCNTFRHFLHL